MNFLEQLAARRRFGMRPGLSTIRAVCRSLGDPQERIRAVHIAGTNGKGAVAALLDASLRSAGLKVGRYTSPHLVRLNERFFLNGSPVEDDKLEEISLRVEKAVSSTGDAGEGTTFFEALTAVAFSLYAESGVDAAVLETGLGGRLDATNVCNPALTVITRIGLDHCDWLGDTVEKIAVEKAGIIKSGVPVVLGENLPEVREIIEKRAKELDAPFYYAPDMALELEIPESYSLAGSFNRENALTVIAALKVIRERKLINLQHAERLNDGFSNVVWPGRFQQVGNVLVDGAHNPPAARALVNALKELPEKKYILVAGFCADKDVGETLSILAPFVSKAYAIKTNNPRSLEPSELALKMRSQGIDADTSLTLSEALRLAKADVRSTGGAAVLVCGSLFLAGEALVALNAYPWSGVRFDPSERL